MTRSSKSQQIPCAFLALLVFDIEVDLRTLKLTFVIYDLFEIKLRLKNTKTAKEVTINTFQHPKSWTNKTTHDFFLYKYIWYIFIIWVFTGTVKTYDVRAKLNLMKNTDLHSQGI